MDMNGRGPRDGQRGSDGRGFNFSFGFRPTRMRRRSLGFLFPFGALFALPGLMIGGWVTIMVLGIIVNVFGSILGSVAGFFGLSGAKRRMAVPRTQVNADAYVVAETLAIVAMGDRLVNTSTSRVYAPITRSSSGGSGSSGGSSYSGSYSGSSGSSHSGSGRSF